MIEYNLVQFYKNIEEVIMKKFKRLLAILVASMMVFSLVGCGGDKETNTNPTTEAPTTEAPTTEAPTDAPETPTTEAPADQATELTVNLHYLREDGNYEGWNVCPALTFSSCLYTSNTEKGNRTCVLGYKTTQPKLRSKS